MWDSGHSDGNNDDVIVGQTTTVTMTRDTQTCSVTFQRIKRNILNAKIVHVQVQILEQDVKYYSGSPFFGICS
jgi:hypothetical protein